MPILTRHQLLDLAVAETQAAHRAHTRGVAAERDAHLSRAAGYYRRADQVAMADWCRRHVGSPAGTPAAEAVLN